jgi:parallel beta-helix repeat protein
VKTFRGTAGLGWAVAVTVLGWAATATAGNCGGAVACACGDTATSNTMLQQNLGPCAISPALRVRSGVVLTCADGIGISGTGPGPNPTSWYGILLEDAEGAEVRNCRVSLFKRGIRVDGGKNNQIVGNLSFNNWGYNIEVAGASTGNLVQNNLVDNTPGATLRSDEGIHNGSGSDNTRILDNTVRNSRAENIYVLNSKGVQVVGNQVSETDSASIFIKNSHNVRVANNTVTKGSITVRGNSSGNTLEGNTISAGRGYLFEAHRDESGDPSPGYWNYPRRNTVIGGSVKDPILIPNTGIRPCLRFEGSYKNRVDQLQLDPACTLPSQTPDGGQESVGNVINTIPLQ